MFRNIKIILVTLLVVAITMLTTATLNQSSRLIPQNSVYDSVAYPASLNGFLAGCGDIYTFIPEQPYFGTISEDYEEQVPTAPLRVPAYGYFDEAEFPADAVKAYDKNFLGFDNETVLRAMWQGYTVMWADVDVNNSAYQFAVNYVETWNEEHDEGKIILLPWVDDERTIPEERMFAFASWGSTQSCEGFSETVFSEFLNQVEQDENNVSDRDRLNPPVAPLTGGELLFPFPNLRG